MFICLAGLRGAGKSYASTLMAEKALVADRPVWANYHLDFSKNPKVPVDKCWRADDINDLAYMRGTPKKSGLFIFDEAHWKLSSREWKDMRPETHQYLAQSRKIDMDVVLVSQNFKRLDTIVRELVERVDEYHRIGRLGFCVSYRADDVDSAKRKKVGASVFWLRKRIFDSYDTRELFGALLASLPARTFPSNGGPVREGGKGPEGGGKPYTGATRRP